MHTRPTSILAALVAIAAFAVVAVLTGGRPVVGAASGGTEPSDSVLETVELARERLGQVELRGRQSLRLQLTMPYFSFGGRQPRQET
ncbi:hypothetical protein [Rehaibacterium terrae]|jgi:hypothetical protein|uniref:Uncharacterized protein n=1 Tax=Rehaibacterium terrae TaxID=1341696 RepID=A0A7W7Y0B5_9GAMM|nr:hypothetical protein [Rehaibacterium terrae]MBB5015758.1 hypothetical protein [Rehaibacterium terrae]